MSIECVGPFAFGAKILLGLRHRPVLEILGCPAQYPFAHRQPLRNQRGVDQLADPYVDIDVLFDQIHDAVRQQQVDLDLRVLGEEGRQRGDDEQMADQHPRMDA